MHIIYISDGQRNVFTGGMVEIEEWKTEWSAMREQCKDVSPEWRVCVSDVYDGATCWWLYLYIFCWVNNR